MAANGFTPSTASPAAKVIACCSAMPTSNVRLGNLREGVTKGLAWWWLGGGRVRWVR